MDTDGHALVCSKSIHQRSQSTGCVLVRKAPTNTDSQSRFQTGQGRLRWRFKRNLEKVGNVKSTWPGCEVKKLGTCHCCNTTPTVHTRIPGRRLSSPTTECILCGGDPPPMTARRNHFSRTWVQGWKGSQLQAIKPSQLDDVCSANNCLQDDSKGGDEQGELQGCTLQSHQQHLKPITRDCISPSTAIVFQVVLSSRSAVGVDVWSNHACLVGL